MILGKHLQDILVHDEPNWKVCGIYFCNSQKALQRNFYFGNHHQAKKLYREISILEHCQTSLQRNFYFGTHCQKALQRNFYFGTYCQKALQRFFFSIEQ